MADKVQFELVSPEKLLLSEAVDMVVVPGTEGNFGVLPGHSLLISTVRPGVIDVYDGATVSERIFVSGGFAEVTPERCTVLATEVAPVTELNRTEAEKRLAEAEADLASLDPNDLVAEEMVLERAQTARALIETIEDVIAGGH